MSIKIMIEQERHHRLQAGMNQEAQAVAELQAFARNNKALLLSIWHWGNGDGGGILDVIANEIGATRAWQRPRPEKTVKGKKVISATLRTKVFERDAYRCVSCGSHIDLCCDHIIPESKGGPTTLENLQAMCRPCNTKKGAK